MNELIKVVAQRSGISEDKARMAVDTVVSFLKNRAPAGLSGQIDSLIGGGEGAAEGGMVSGMASKVGGMFGKKEPS